jgi:sporulation protein YlmC with PRC-barrel domain
MLITRVKPTQLWGKKVYDDDGHYLGQVVAVASRRGVARKVVVQCARGGEQVNLLPRSDARVVAGALVVPAAEPSVQPRLWVVR